MPRWRRGPRLSLAGPRPNPMPPGPKGLRLIGNLSAYEEDRLGFLTGCAREYGDIARFSDSVYVISSAELVNQVLTRTNVDFAQDQNLRRDGVDGRRGSADLDRWLQARSAAIRGLSRPAVQAHAERMLRLARSRLSAWRDGAEIDVVREMEEFTSLAIADFCFGEDASRVPALAARALDALFPLISSPFRFPDWLPLPRHRGVDRALADLEQEIGVLIAARRAGRLQAEAALVDGLLGGRSRLADTEACRVLVSILLAAHGVPAAALAWIWFLLSGDPARATALHQEVRLVAGARPLQAADLPELRYATAVVKESLRLYPPTWLSARRVLNRSRLGGYPLHPGQYLVFSPYVIQRDPHYFDRPDEFVPERWLDAGFQSQLPKYAYFPFGGGPRACIGMTLATVELVLLTAVTAQQFRIRRLLEHPVATDARRTLVPRGFRARLEAVVEPSTLAAA